MTKFFPLKAFSGGAKLFSIKGGVHPKDFKALSAECAIERMPAPSLLRVPLQQHIGAEAEPIVKQGDDVAKGQPIAVGRGAVSAAVHAPTSGKVIAIGRFVAPHPSGLPVATISIRPDGEERWAELPPPLDPETAAPSEIAARVAASGVVGMGGATFPSAVKLNLGKRFTLETLVINAAECEPYLTCDDRLLRERSEAVADGVFCIAKALGVSSIIVAIEANKPKAIEAMTNAVAGLAIEARVATVPTRYPMGSEKHLVQTLTGRETPARALTADIGIVVHNAATAHAVHRAMRYGEPLISRVVTVSGKAVRRPANVETLIGTPITDLLDHCGGLSEEPQRLLLGGPMMGQPAPSLRAPIVKGVNGVLGLTAAECRRAESMPCIRCASCVSVCPCGLTPLELHARIKNEELDGAVEIGLLDCVACGSCSFVCPSNIPLVQSFNYAKGKLTQQQRTKHQQEETKRLAQQREERMARIAAAKKEAMAKRKAEQAAKKKAKEQKAKEAAALKAAQEEAQSGAQEPAPGAASAGAAAAAAREATAPNENPAQKRDAAAKAAPDKTEAAQ
ncbi:MAG: electron transport complex subunit RsxC [Pseudomonadota bacterium]